MKGEGERSTKRQLLITATWIQCCRCRYFGRPLRSLRLSVTDRCNLRCKYCMPEEDYVWLPREDVLTS